MVDDFANGYLVKILSRIIVGVTVLQCEYHLLAGYLIL